MSTSGPTLSAPHPTHQAPRYRADIDGLRAVAVLLVVFNHLQVHHAEGGFIGVDVFFVISGYLIGASMIGEFKRKAFSLTAFYERRVRRIFPALLVMLIVTTALAWRFLVPEPFVAYSRSLVAALLSVSNFLFWSQAGYFDAQSVTKPLLHTWSLAVEEQFYVFFPLYLFAIYRWRPKILRESLWVVAALTLALSAWVVTRDPNTAFFWSPLRAWELLTGVLVSQYRFKWLESRMPREAVAGVGLLLIFGADFLYGGKTPFPGLAAIPPCLGAAMLIAAGQVGESGTGKLLGLPPIRFIGLISYSLYLWHWPVIVFQNSTLLLAPQSTLEHRTKLVVLAVSLVLGGLSWWLVETPFRKGRFKPARAPLFALNGVVAASLLAVGVAVIHAKGSPSRMPADMVRVGSFLDEKTYDSWRTGTCFLLPKHNLSGFRAEDCLATVPGKKNVLLLGYSTAAHLYPGLVSTFPQFNIQEATAAGCMAYGEPAMHDQQYLPNCAGIRHVVHGAWIATHRPDVVMIAGLWDQDSVTRLPSEIQFFRQMGVPVILFGPPPNFTISAPTLIVAEMRRQESPEARVQHLSSYLQPRERLDGELRQMADREHVRYVSYSDLLCTDTAETSARPGWHTADNCPLFANNGDPLLFDEHHLTVAGSIQLAEALHSRGIL